jgi:hypothetical protein
MWEDAMFCKDANRLLYMSFWVLGIWLDVEYTPHRAFEDGPNRGFRNVGKTQSDAGKYTKEHIQGSEHGENLKSRMQIKIFFMDSIPFCC